MSSRTDIAIGTKLADARALEDAIRVLRRRRVDTEGMSRAAFCRILMSEADRIYTEVRLLRGADRATRSRNERP